MSAKNATTADESSEAFWLAVEEAAESVRSAPAWALAGIALNPEHFETFRPEASRGSPFPGGEPRADEKADGETGE